MASKPQRGGSAPADWSRQVNRPEYEDFKLQIEEKEGARVAVIHVPGFLKEQMKITSEEGKNIRVQGQRPLTSNRWSHFNQILSVPENCDVNKIHAKFHRGILTITMPKEVPKMPTRVLEVEKSAEQVTRENVNKSVPQKAGEGKVVPPSSSEPSDEWKTRISVSIRLEDLAAAKASEPSDECKTSKSKSIRLVDLAPAPAEAPAEASVSSKILGDKKKVIGKVDSCAAREEKPKEDGERSTNEKTHGIEHVMETAKQRVTNVVRKRNNEDRQMLINIGVAALVIVVIGACVSWSFRSYARRGNHS